jgi:hypothetical protein
LKVSGSFWKGSEGFWKFLKVSKGFWKFPEVSGAAGEE